MGNYRRKRAFFLMLALCLGFAVLLNAQQQQTSLKRLKEIRQEIARLRQELNQQKTKELNYLDQLEQLDKEGSLIRKLISELQNHLAETRKKIHDSNKRLMALMDEFDQQKKVYMERLVHFYKHGRMRDLEILLTSSNLNQALIWLKYARKISNADKRRLENLRHLKQQIEEKTKEHRAHLAQLDRLLTEKEDEEKQLLAQRKEKEQILRKIQKDKNILAQRIAEYERSAREIERMIRDAERSRITTPLDLSRPSLFPSLKGKMIWPTRGKLLHRFGKVKNPQLNTYYMNIGIDIKASFGQEVLAVCPGVITKITWQRSRGNIVIINHHEGYYTVYTHLSEIDVVLGQQVDTGTVIGRVGETGSISGPMLHFEIWYKTQPENPLLWLAKQPSS